MEENVIQINGGTTINVDVSVKNVMHGKKIMFGILQHVILEMGNILQVLWMIQQFCVIKLYSHTTETKTVLTNFNDNM